MYICGRKHALRKTLHLPNQTCDTVSLYWKKGHIHGNRLGTADKVIRSILQPGKRLRDERYK